MKMKTQAGDLTFYYQWGTLITYLGRMQGVPFFFMVECYLDSVALGIQMKIMPQNIHLVETNWEYVLVIAEAFNIFNLPLTIPFLDGSKMYFHSNPEALPILAALQPKKGEE
uniref:Uncharacterized protein n=1 Tax=Oryza nivara TaxID=4536 RepID=A0A0E0IHY6_ORYNI